MSARGWVAFFIAYTLLMAIPSAVWNYHVDPSLGGGVLVLVHLFNIGLGLFNIGRAIADGLTYGWKS
jgi:hypothetical protein